MLGFSKINAIHPARDSNGKIFRFLGVALMCDLNEWYQGVRGAADVVRPLDLLAALKRLSYLDDTTEKGRGRIMHIHFLKNEQNLQPSIEIGYENRVLDTSHNYDRKLSTNSTYTSH